MCVMKFNEALLKINRAAMTKFPDAAFYETQGMLLQNAQLVVQLMKNSLKPFMQFLPCQQQSVHSMKKVRLILK